MILLKDSSKKELLRDQYEQLWSELLISDEEKAEKILKKLKYELLPSRKKKLLKNTLIPTHLAWIIPSCVIAFFGLAYVLFIRLSLWLE
ncbi:hypothetical protein [Paenibacillus glacialis]|uniref:Uncharacterized protein n=1 Tax=Paenibacillus glacialis TaxID=494026 RepID=A0A162K8S9_9BACL|nr:hypothetical protein [Paenibacillus glacialis]OAB42308.1 hypothetical protein PGLA_13500 [Paenibacillus glacialis]